MPTHWAWNQCAHGGTVTSSPTSTSSMQMEHWALPSVPKSSIVTLRFGSDAMSSLVAGPGALPLAFCSREKDLVLLVYVADALSTLRSLSALVIVMIYPMISYE